MLKLWQPIAFCLLPERGCGVAGVNLLRNNGRDRATHLRRIAVDIDVECDPEGLVAVFEKEDDIRSQKILARLMAVRYSGMNQKLLCMEVAQCRASDSFTAWRSGRPGLANCATFRAKPLLPSHSLISLDQTFDFSSPAALLW